MNSKIKAYWAAALAALSYIVGYLASVPPTLQNDFVVNLQVFLPVHTRPYVSPAAHLITTAAGLYAIRHAAKSGPQTPPTNPPAK